LFVNAVAGLRFLAIFNRTERWKSECIASSDQLATGTSAVMSARHMAVLIALLACALSAPAWAEGGGFTIGPSGQQAYPNQPQYQYPTNSRTQRKCPKGQALFQGRCRIKLPVR
jgi:hypothetical protein